MKRKSSKQRCASPRYWDKSGFSIREDKTFFCLGHSQCKLWFGCSQSEIELQLHFGPSSIKSPKSDCEDFFCGLALPPPPPPPPLQSKILARSMLDPKVKIFLFENVSAR